MVEMVDGWDLTSGAVGMTDSMECSSTASDVNGMQGYLEN
jgi:hypothetical protein